MVQDIFRYFLIVTVLVVILGFGTKGFGYALTDAYNVLIGNGWTAKDALGFLGTSIAGTLAMNPSIAPAVAAGALSAYIVVKGSQLIDIYRDWRNMRTGIAMLNPVDYSQSVAVKQLRNGEYGWKRLYFTFSYYGSDKWNYEAGYIETYNKNGSLENRLSDSGGYRYTKATVISMMNIFLSVEQELAKDAEGKAFLTAMLQTAYNYVVSGTAYNVNYTREVLPAFEGGSTGVNASTLDYRVNVDPQDISEDGVQYLGDPDAFYQWFVTNYMNGTNEGTFVTPSNEIYDEIRSDLQTIITQLNNLQSTGGVSEETLNQMKTDIINSITSVMNTSESDILNALDSKFSGLESTLTGVSNSVNSLQTDINTKFGDLDSALTGVNSNLDALGSDLTSVQTSIDTLSGEINETLQEGLEQEQGFWDRLMEWLDVNLFERLQALLQDLFFPTQEQLDELFDIELPEYQKNFAAEVSFTSQSASMPISLFGATVDLSGYITQYASGLRQFMNIFVSGIAALFVIQAFRVHLNID